MKPINLKSLLQAKSSLEDVEFERFLKHYNIEIKGAEIADLSSLVGLLCASDCKIGPLDKYYVGYKIPQIGKEFDLLRFGPTSVINLELKSKCDVQKIRTQLLRNRYYLRFIGRKVLAFTYVSGSKQLFALDADDELVEMEVVHLAKEINSHVVNGNEVPDLLFNPSDYLVSPFNSTKKFLAGEYFLTHQQEEMKSQIVAKMAHSAARFISIIGSAGTGKTLLTYDIAKHYIADAKKPLIIHCG